MAKGYGSDTWCLDSYQPGRRARGSMVVVQALYRRLITPRGTLRGLTDQDEELAYGLDVSGYVGALGYDRVVPVLRALVRAECAKDDRVRDIVCEVFREQLPDGSDSLVIRVDGTLVEDDESFSLTLRVTDTAVTLIGGDS